MGDESPQNTMNLDLNLAPMVHPSQDDQPQTMSFEDWLHPRARQRLRSLWRPIPIPMEARNMALGLTSSSGLVIDEEQNPETIKTNEKDEKIQENEDEDKKDVEKTDGDECSFFDCNICLDIASEPVVTCCGHLFCWPCLYRWLFVHSEAKECPICKGEVTMKTITPIYSRGTRTSVPEVVDSSVKIPSRPQANRIESWRQSIQRNTLNMPILEMIQRLDNRFEPNPRPVPASILSRIFTSRGIRRGQDTAPTESPEIGPVGSEGGGGSNRPANLTPPAESFVESFFQEEVAMMDDRHSMSSIAAIIQSESQTADTGAETDSRVSISTSRRRCETSTSRVSDVDSGDSRSRRRRLQ